MTATDVTFVIFREGKALMQHRTDDARRYPGAWCFPGGCKEEGETTEQCVVREVLEEYGLRATEDDVQFVTQYEHDGTDIDDVCLCKISADQQPRLREGKAFDWKTMEEIEMLALGFEQERILSAIKALLG